MRRESVRFPAGEMKAMRRSAGLLISALAFAWATPARADGLCSQLGNLVSRPTVSTTACSIGEGSAMLESGFTNQSSPGPSGTETQQYPQITMRDGVGHGIEYILTPPSYERISTQPALSGDLDGSLGVKYQFANKDRFASAVAATYTLGTGTPGLETSGDGIDLALDTDYTLSPAFSLSSTFAYFSTAPGAAAPGGRTNAFAPSVGISYGLPANISLFVEGFGRSSNGPGTSGQYGVDGGVSYDAGSRLQFDANLFDTIGASGGRSHAVGFGAAYLFGKAP